MKIFDDGEQALSYLEGLKDNLGKSFIKKFNFLLQILKRHKWMD